MRRNQARSARAIIRVLVRGDALLVQVVVEQYSGYGIHLTRVLCAGAETMGFPKMMVIFASMH